MKTEKNLTREEAQKIIDGIKNQWMHLETSGERVRTTDKFRDLGHGLQIEVIYSDESIGFEHVGGLIK